MSMLAEYKCSEIYEFISDRHSAHDICFSVHRPLTLNSRYLHFSSFMYSAFFYSSHLTIVHLTFRGNVFWILQSVYLCFAFRMRNSAVLIVPFDITALTFDNQRCTTFDNQRSTTDNQHSTFYISRGLHRSWQRHWKDFASPIRNAA